MAEKPRNSNDGAPVNNENDQELDDDELKQIEKEKRNAQELGEEAMSKAKAKLQFKTENSNAGLQRPGEEFIRKLDSSVKKNSAFVRKLRTVTEQQRASLTSDLKGLNLTKYIQETALSIAEAKLKVADIGCTVHLSVLLHQRYNDFSQHLLDSLQRFYSPEGIRGEDKSVVTAKYRIGLRFLGELIVSGIIDEDIGISLLNDLILTIMKVDRNGHPYLGVIVSFVRHCAEDFAGIVPRKQRLLLSKYGIQPPRSELIPPAKQRDFLEMFRKYFFSVRDYLTSEHKAMHQRERRNHEIIFSKGEIHEDRRLANEAAQKAYDKLLTNTSILAEVLDEDMPDLPEYQAPQDTSDMSIELQFPIGRGEATEDDPHSLWEDEDAKSFYEGITDIKPFVPAILFEENKKTSESSDTEEGATLPAEEQDEDQVLEQMIKDTEAVSLEEEECMPPEDDVDEDEKGSGQGVEHSSAASRLDEFLVRLRRLMNRKLVDEFAVEFCMSMNTKSNRRKLARALFNVEKNRMDLIPFYARLVATLDQCFNDIAPMLIEFLIKDFRFQVFKKDQVRVDSKLKNVRFIAELTKFGLCSKTETMKCITILLHSFTHHNLEMACLFIEHCGRFLIRTPDSHLRAKALLQIMVRKKQVQHLDPRQISLVENALYYANPPDTPQIVHERLPPMLEYIKKLLYKELNKLNTEKTLRQIRKLQWGDPEVFQWAVSSLVQIWHVKYNNIHCVANLLAGLKAYQEDATIQVVDGVLEDIRLGLELNLPKMNQRRVSTVKFLGELYNFQLIESNVVFRALYMLLSFGANPDGSPSPLDPHNSYFRVRLICILLDTCGNYFDRGSSKKYLDSFLVFFQCYLFSKRQPLSLEVEHLVLDCIETLRPGLEMYKTHQEAVEAALALEMKFKDKIGHTQDMEEDPEDDEENRENGHKPREEEEEEDDDVDDDDEDLPEDVDRANVIFEEEPVLTAGPKLITCHEDDEFVSALDKLISEDLPVRRNEVFKGLDVDAAIPLHLKGTGIKRPSVPLLEEEGELKMTFKLMTKKGHKQQLRELNIPVDSGLATQVMGSREAKEDEHRRMKELVLNHERRQEEEAYQTMIAETANKLQAKIKIVKRSPEVPRASSNAPQRQHHSHKQQVGNGPFNKRDPKDGSQKLDGPAHFDSRNQGGGGNKGRGRGRSGGGRGGGRQGQELK